MVVQEVQGPSGPQVLVGGPSGQLNFVLRALWALRPGDPRNNVVIGRKDDRNGKILFKKSNFFLKNT